MSAALLTYRFRGPLPFSIWTVAREEQARATTLDRCIVLTVKGPQCAPCTWLGKWRNDIKNQAKEPRINAKNKRARSGARHRRGKATTHATAISSGYSEALDESTSDDSSAPEERGRSRRGTRGGLQGKGSSEAVEKEEENENEKEQEDDGAADPSDGGGIIMKDVREHVSIEDFAVSEEVCAELKNISIAMAMRAHPRARTPSAKKRNEMLAQKGDAE
ncbi:MAG: hypothetical protein Q9184_004393 [Pyrenodesmia sp. 2 TL-2023]